MEKKGKLRLISTILLMGVLFLSGCSGPPRSLQKTAERAVEIQNAELSDVNNMAFLGEPKLIDKYQVSETEWCLAHEVGDGIYFASLWREVDSTWQQVELRYNEPTCDWAR